jgi:hypothetical protein
VRLLRASELGAGYEHAFTEWDESGAAAEWDRTAADGLRADAAG